MELLTLLLLLAVGLHFLKARERAGRIALLGGYLSRYQIEALMEGVTEGYLRALGESDAQRRAQIWTLMAATEKNLVLQLQAFSSDFAQVSAEDARVSTLPLALPYARLWWAQAGFDMRDLLQLHARAIAAAVADVGDGSPEARKAQAFMVTAELYLLQHSCHWYCRSLGVASARLVLAHQSDYPQVLASVAPGTRRSYREITGI